MMTNSLIPLFWTIKLGLYRKSHNFKGSKLGRSLGGLHRKELLHNVAELANLLSEKLLAHIMSVYRFLVLMISVLNMLCDKWKDNSQGLKGVSLKHDDRLFLVLVKGKLEVCWALDYLLVLSLIGRGAAISLLEHAATHIQLSDEIAIFGDA
jgi:hypothetical protein